MTNSYNLSNSIIPLIIDLCIIFGGLGIVFSRKIIYSALYLGLVFISIALLYLFLDADFMAATQILIYVGAVNVIILFAIMLVNKPDIVKNKNNYITEIISGIVVGCFFTFLTISIVDTKWDNLYELYSDNNPTRVINDSVEFIGINLLTENLLPFELLSVLLLIALIGAVNIAKKDNFLDVE